MTLEARRKLCLQSHDRSFVIRSKSNLSTKTENTDSTNKRKTKLDLDRDYDKKRKRTFQEQWPNDFPWLNADDRDAVFCKICREYPSLADTSSTLFASKKVDRKDTLLSHQLSAKH